MCLDDLVGVNEQHIRRVLVDRVIFHRKPLIGGYRYSMYLNDRSYAGHSPDEVIDQIFAEIVQRCCLTS
jgi:hypothetical protein